MTDTQNVIAPEMVATHRGIATALAKEFKPIIDAFLPDPEAAQPVRDFLWNNKIAILRCLEFIAALHRLPTQSLPRSKELQEWIDNYPGDPEALRDALAEIEPTQSPLSQGGEAVEALKCVWDDLDICHGYNGRDSELSDGTIQKVEAVFRSAAYSKPALGAEAVAELLKRADELMGRRDAGLCHLPESPFELIRELVAALRSPAIPAPAQGVTVTEEMVACSAKIIADMSPQWRLCGDPPCRRHDEMPTCRCLKIARAALEAALHPAEKE